jgi:hypothetical protein
LLALKVVGFYPAPKDSKGNVIIAPSLIVYYHGSDYDVDTLFVIKKKSWDKPTIDMNDVLSSYDESYQERSELVIEQGHFVGENKVGGQPLHTFLDTYIVKIHQRIEELTEALLDKNKTKADKSLIDKAIKIHNDNLTQISEVADLSAKNSIINLFSSSLADPKNRQDLLTPISFSRVAAVKAEIEKELMDLLSGKDMEATELFLNELEEAKMIERPC